MTLAVQDLARAEDDPLKRLFALDNLAASMADNIAAPRPVLPALKKISINRLLQLYADLSRFWMGDNEKTSSLPGQGQPETSPPKRYYYTSEQLEVSAWRMAILTDQDVNKILCLDLKKFNRNLKIMDAAWAGIRLDLLDPIQIPHLKKVRPTFEKMLAPIRALEAPDASEWFDHFEKAESYL